MPADLARQMARLALCVWPGLAARHAILGVIGCLLTNRCQVEKLLFYDLQPLRQAAQYAWDYRWSRIIECDALLASMVAQEYDALP